MKKIVAAVTTRVISESNYLEIRDSISHDLINFLHYQNIVPILIPNHLPLSSEILDYADILILSGGNSVLINYSSKEIKNDVFLSAVQTRNSVEIQLIDKFRLESKPIFGICHGLQIINHYFGGNLKKVKSKNNHVSNEHAINIISDNFEKWFGAKKLVVNSYHNYGVDNLGKNLEIMALSEDGEIESIGINNEKIMAIMWHPERAFSKKNSHKLNRNIISKYINFIE